MRRIINGVLEGKWDVFLKDWVERRNGKKYDSDANYGLSIIKNTEFYSRFGSSTYHLRAQSAYDIRKLYEIRILTVDRKSPDNMWPIVCLVHNENEFDEIEEFDKFGNSNSGNYKLHLENIYFDDGDYVVTDLKSIGIFYNSWYMHCGIDKDNIEHLTSFGYGHAIRPATEDEIKLVDEMLWVNNKKWNKETLKLEDIK